MNKEIYLITNRKLCSNERFIEVIKEASFNGVGKIILREKDLSFYELEILYNKLMEVINKESLIIINSNMELAIKYGTFGIQLPYKAFIEYGGKSGIEKEQNYYGEVGVSIHSVEEAMECDRLKADYIIASHIFETKCKEGLKPKGIKFVKEICEKISIPVIALGGIKSDNYKEVLQVGASGIAIMSEIMSSNNVKETIDSFNLL